MATDEEPHGSEPTWSGGGLIGADRVEVLLVVEPTGARERRHVRLTAALLASRAFSYSSTVLDAVRARRKPIWLRWSRGSRQLRHDKRSP